jgi:cell wall assembly regulator SMI1
MDDLWERLDRQIALHAPELSASLRGPATHEQVKDAQAAFGIQLPDEVQQAYLWHDGAIDKRLIFEDLGPPLFEPFCGWCSLEAMLALWHADRDNYGDELNEDPYFFTEEDPSWNERAIRPWTAVPPSWLCIGYSGTRSRVFLDMLPGPRGTTGQLIYSDGEGSVQVLSASLREYLGALADGIEGGRVVFVDGHWRLRETGNLFELPAVFRLPGADG